MAQCPPVLYYTLNVLLRADGFTSIVRNEGIGGLYKGTSLALFGVSSGAVQFMSYEQLKNFAFNRKRRRIEKEGGTWRDGEEKLVRFHISRLHITSTRVSHSTRFRAVKYHIYDIICGRQAWCAHIYISLPSHSLSATKPCC